jgi:hypothetical protein
MKVIIKVDEDDNEKETELLITDEHLNNDNFIDISIGEVYFTVCLDDLVSALDPFVKIRELNHQRDKMYGEE